MDIPNCYDPVYQEERRQLQADRAVSQRPVCDCCFKPVKPGRPYYKLSVLKELCTICEDCKEDLEESKQILEQ